MTTPILINLDLIDDNPYQPRLHYDEASIRETAESIKTNGLLQIPTARASGDGRYQLAFGHRRRRAYSLLAQTDPAYATMPLVIRELDDLAMVRQAWSENRDRRDISAYEEARAIEKYLAAFGWSQKQVAEHLGLDRSTIANKLGLLRLPTAVLELFAAGQLSERQAQALKPLSELPINNWAEPIALYGSPEIRAARSIHDLIPLTPTLAADRLRELVEHALDKVTIRLDNEPWAQEALPGDGFHAACCTNCVLRMKSTNRCPSRPCAALKTAFHRKRMVQAAATAVKLPAVSVESYGEYDRLGDVSLAALRAEASRRRCMCLGVAHLSYGHHPVAGHPDSYIVCAHGGDGCACKAAVLKAANPASSKAAQEKADRKTIRQLYQVPAERMVTGALTDLPQGVLRMLVRKIDQSAYSKVDAAAPAKQIAEALAAALVREEIKYNFTYAPDVEKAKHALESMLSQAGLPVPWLDETTPILMLQPVAESDEQAAFAVRTCLIDAGECGVSPEAHHCLDKARLVLRGVISREVSAQLLSEINMAAISIAQAEAEAHPDAICAE